MIRQDNMKFYVLDYQSPRQTLKKFILFKILVHFEDFWTFLISGPGTNVPFGPLISQFLLIMYNIHSLTCEKIICCRNIFMLKCAPKREELEWNEERKLKGKQIEDDLETIKLDGKMT